jgi:nephrocystin-3
MQARSDDRQVRVFISSTFRDMQEEREILIKKIFPQLRKLCEERLVAWTEVDLRWGITTEQAAEGKVLPLCLEEIQRCRPYFIGLLGERYGWVPKPASIPADLLQAQPWLQEHLNHSVTELEIIHGVLREPDMHGHAFFYFRDPGYLTFIPSEQRSDFITEDPDARGRLTKLKQKIRQARDQRVCELRENYSSPEKLGQWILEDFTKLVDRLYPKDQTPDPLDEEAACHEAYAANRRLAFVGRNALMSHLDRYAAAPGKPLVVTGESGSGKSALLAEWVKCWRKNHGQALIIQHYLGSTPESADWQAMVRRVLGELKREFIITGDIPVQPDDLRSALGPWTAKAEGGRPVVFVFDGLNQLSGDGASKQLAWLPEVFPPNFRVIVSSLPGEALEALRRRGYPEIEVPLFSQTDIATASLAYFKVFGKTPSTDLTAKLESVPAARNPLYLRAVLDELRQFGRHDKLEDKAAFYLAAPHLSELFDRIITRWQEDFGAPSDHPDIVRRSLCLISCARFGLTETELLELLGRAGEPLPRQSWTPFYLAAEKALVLRGGFLNFGHDYLRTAAAKRWLDGAEPVRKFRQQLAKYFSEIDSLTDRKLDELPGLLRDLEKWDDLTRLLGDIPAFLRMRANPRRKLELHRLWTDLHPRFEVARVYEEALKNLKATDLGKHQLSVLSSELANFHSERGEAQAAETLYKEAVDLVEASGGADGMQGAATANNLACQYVAEGRLEEAEPLLRRALEINERLAPDKTEHAKALGNLGELLCSMKRPHEAEHLFRKALSIEQDLWGDENPDIAKTLHGLATVLNHTGRPNEAEPLLRQALSIQEKYHGFDHLDVAKALHNLAAFLVATGRIGEAEPLFRRALEIVEPAVGRSSPLAAEIRAGIELVNQEKQRLHEAEQSLMAELARKESHPGGTTDLGATLYQLASILIGSERREEAKILLGRALSLYASPSNEPNKPLGELIHEITVLLLKNNRLRPTEPLFQQVIAFLDQHISTLSQETASDLHHLAIELRQRNLPDVAMLLQRRSVAIFENIKGPDHPELAIALNSLALTLQALKRWDEAEPLFRQSLNILEKDQRTDPESLAAPLNGLGLLLLYTRRASAAEPYFRQALAIQQRVHGDDHPSLAPTINNLAMLCLATGQVQEAANLYERALWMVSVLFQRGQCQASQYQTTLGNYARTLQMLGIPDSQINAKVQAVVSQATNSRP